MKCLCLFVQILAKTDRGIKTEAKKFVLTCFSDTTGFSVDESIKKDDAPPLELCIKTKWKDAVIHCSSSSF